MDYSPPGATVHGIFQARILEWVAIPSLGGLLNPGIETASPMLSGRFFAAVPYIYMYPLPLEPPFYPLIPPL